MNEVVVLCGAAIAGFVLGGFFFGGLWWTVRRGVVSERPALWFLCSMLTRTAVVVLCFYFFLSNDWRTLLAGLAGFTVARFAVLRQTRRAENNDRSVQKSGHAS